MTTQFEEGIIAPKYLCGDTYCSPGRLAGAFARVFPSLYFYLRLLEPFIWLCRRSAKGICDDSAWIHGSVRVSELLEETGCKILVDGMQHIDAVDGPCIFVANHMSTLETFMLPSIIRPRRPVTFVLKASLVELPFFGGVIRSRNPIVVGRENPRKDLVTILEEGTKRLQQGISLIVFPQSTRSKTFAPEHFNSIGVKLAKRAEVPIIPLALKTDAWGQGKLVKDLGMISPNLPIRYCFGNPIHVIGTGKNEQKAICDFIGSKLTDWNATDGIAMENKKGLPESKP